MTLSISNLSIQSGLTTALQAETATLTQLSTELSTEQKYTNLTDYAPDDASNLVNLQSTATQKQAYLSVINTVNTKLSIYDSTMTDMGSIVAQAQNLANDNPNYSATAAANIAVQASNYLTSVGLDLNQKLNGQYIYAGTRYNTAPVSSNLATLPTSTLSPTIVTDGSTLPSYDSQYAAATVTMTTLGQDVTVGGTISTPQSASVTVNGTTYSYAIQSGDTTSTIASALATEIAADVPGTSANGSDITVGGSGTINSATAAAASTAAYTTDNASVDTDYSVNYGVSSNNPAFQQLISGLRYLQAAGNATDSATYQTDIQQASSLLTSGLTSLQSLHTTVAYNQNIMTNEQTAQNNAITSLTTQVGDISSVDVTQVSTEITELQTILQASYAVTGDIEKLSITNYLPT